MIGKEQPTRRELIRRATADDLTGILAVNRAAAVAAYADIFVGLPYPAAGVCARYRRLLSDPSCHVFVAVDERILGFVAVRSEHLEALYITPLAWGCGLGSRLYAIAEPLLARDATLWVLEANARGRQFWEHRGWRPDGERRREHPAVALRYRRQVTPSDAGPGSSERA